MKAKLIGVIVLLALSVMSGQAWAVEAQSDGPITVTINIAANPNTLDPALAAFMTDIEVIEQLFIGLVDLDDVTAEVKPELALSWTVSLDGTVYTFTLRSDVYWTDGNPVTAGDVRYGILRSLTPATGSMYGFLLTDIKNAAGYYYGTITDPNQVGVVALDATHLQITLEEPAAHFLTKAALWVARPMPQLAIETYGANWTLPANIVTSGAYRLTEWVANDHIRLDKNATFYDVNNVQIEQVNMFMVDSSTAWTMYQNGQLDTAPVASLPSDPILRQEIRIRPSPCSEYFGFSVSQPPFNNPLVRKAFIAATNRQGPTGLVIGSQPALTYTPPGVFGYVDGYAEGVGIPYNPTQAQQLLAAAGYPNGVGLPPITLWFNTSTARQIIAENIRDNWHAVLGVNVNLQSLPFSTYNSQLNNGQFQIWRLGWCPDYLDAYNFLYESLINRLGAFGGWNNPAYFSLLDQARLEQDSNARKNLYKQAEEILVETDAVLLPLYYSGTFEAVKPYLEMKRSVSNYDVATWRITRVSETVGSGGGSLISYHGDTTIEVPAGAFNEDVEITYTPATGMPPGGNLYNIGHAYDLTAEYLSNGQPAVLNPGQTYTIIVSYTNAEVDPILESTLAFYWWDGLQWVKEPTSVVDTINNTLTATPNHFSLWSILGEKKPAIYLPIVIR